MRISNAILPPFVLAMALLAACIPADSPGPSVAELPEGEPGTPSQPREIRLRAFDQMRFDRSTILAWPGETLRVELFNETEQPIEAMGHNFVLLTRDAQMEEVVRAAIDHRERDFLPPELANHILAATRLLGPMESDAVVFQVPDTPGENYYVCTFPGHAAAGMRGKLVVPVLEGRGIAEAERPNRE
jgi:azurin